MKDHNDNNIFSSEGRYNDTNLNYMGVIFLNKTDIFDLVFHCESHPDHPCEDSGLQYFAGDFFFNNQTPVIACAPGYVERIDWLAGDDPSSESVYIINIGVRFNETVFVTYCFEPFTNLTTHWELQGSWLNVSLGDWVEKGDLIGTFLKIGNYAHIHWDIGVPCMENDYPRPEHFYDTEGYTLMVDLISYLNITRNDGRDRGGCYF
ncbi:MAG TPA: M23 family metallopeptidase [Candidatus Bathyarchaeia archaeon]|nr:M23 family metallopeptidase [Candidatus Bathyarchaeia archaeon]